MYQMTFADLEHDDFKPIKLVRGNDHATFACPVCNSLVGIVELPKGEWIVKEKECPNGHKIRWNNG